MWEEGNGVFARHLDAAAAALDGGGQRQDGLLVHVARAPGDRGHGAAVRPARKEIPAQPRERMHT